MSPEPLRLSARSGRPPPPCRGIRYILVGGGGYSPPRAEYSVPGRGLPVGWASGILAAGGDLLPPVPAPRRGAWRVAQVVAP